VPIVNLISSEQDIQVENMDLQAFFSILWRRKWVVFLTTFATLAIVAAWTYTARPIYEASTTLRVATSMTGSTETINYNIICGSIDEYLCQPCEKPPILDD
jgi:uncharacterized protein involved in exopolysaccharide biosynthesis